MTHTSQRRGLESSEPVREICFLVMGSFFLTDPLKKGAWDVARKEAVDKSVELGCEDGRKIFPDREAFAEWLKWLNGEWIARNRREELPFCINCSGNYDDVQYATKKARVKIHTYSHSIGFFGHVEQLPIGDELALVTMCGHGYCNIQLIRDLLRKIRIGAITVEEAAEELSDKVHCSCGFVSKARAKVLFQRLAVLR